MKALDRWRHQRVLRRMAGPQLLAAFADAVPDAFFVEIGANDGDQHDHLRSLILGSRWRGIMVEPVPYVFERLQRNYAGVDRVICERVAIAPQAGRMPFFHLAEAAGAGAPGWYDAIGSFSREAVLSHAGDIPDLEERLVETQVPTVTFEGLLERHGVERVDLVVIDTEGYDWEILRNVDLGRWKPRLVVYEHYHLSPEDRRSAREHLRSAGYETMEEHFDTFCLDTGPDDDLTRRWRSLSPAVQGTAAYEEGR